MNWVGGWRSRVMKSSDTRKQKEFFEKKRMQNRHNLLAPPASPEKGNVGNMDLLTMFIVNQIALKKEQAGNPKKKHLAKASKSMGVESLELPMSPCSPSRLSLAESKSHYSDQTMSLKKRKHSLLDEFKFKTLSPLVESNLSDTSASAYRHRVQGSVGSFSSTSPSSSEAFNLQSRSTVHISPLPPTESHCTKTAQPVGVSEYNPWSVPYQTQASQSSFANGFQFGSTLHSCESSGPSMEFAENPFTDFDMNDQEEKLRVFGFNSGGEGRVHRIVSDHACESPVACSQGEGYVTSGDVTNSIPSLRYIFEQRKKLAGDSYKHMCHIQDILTTSQSCPSGMSAPTRVMSFNQKVMCNSEHRQREGKAQGISKTLRRINHEQECDDQFVPSCLQTNTQSHKMHKKASPREKDKATQTVGFSSLSSEDASVQCCLLKPARMSVFSEPQTHIHPSRTHKASAARRQTCQSSEKYGNQFAPEIHKVKWNTSRMTSSRKPIKQGPEMTGHESLSKSESQACMKKHPSLNCSHTNAPEQPSENMVLRGERQEGSEEESVNQTHTVNFSCTEEHVNDSSADTGGDRVSEGKGNLKEIADILLMLKQKNKHP